MRHLPAIAIVTLAALILWLRPTPPAAVEAAPVAAPSVDPAHPRERWAMDLLARLGNTQPDAATVAMVVEWTRAEDAGGDAFSRNNPLNTTMCGYNMVGSINSDGACGVGHYATYADGLDATVATLAGGAYVEIVAALQANDPERAKRALWASPWAESHYGYGANWPR